jgi:hypothetical protein
VSVSEERGRGRSEGEGEGVGAGGSEGEAREEKLLARLSILPPCSTASRPSRGWRRGRPSLRDGRA